MQNLWLKWKKSMLQTSGSISVSFAKIWNVSFSFASVKHQYGKGSKKGNFNGNKSWLMNFKVQVYLVRLDNWFWWRLKKDFSNTERLTIWHLLPQISQNKQTYKQNLSKTGIPWSKVIYIVQWVLNCLLKDCCESVQKNFLKTINFKIFLCLI